MKRHSSSSLKDHTHQVPLKNIIRTNRVGDKEQSSQNAIKRLARTLAGGIFDVEYFGVEGRGPV
jgi:hypothetical protein